MTLLGVGVGGGNVAGFQVTAEADGELVTRAEDLDAGVTQPQGIADRRRPEVGEGGRSRAQKRGGRVGDDLVDEAGVRDGAARRRDPDFGAMLRSANRARRGSRSTRACR